MSERRENRRLCLYTFSKLAPVFHPTAAIALCNFAIRMLLIAKIYVKCAHLSATMYARTIRCERARTSANPYRCKPIDSKDWESERNSRLFYVAHTGKCFKLLRIYVACMSRERERQARAFTHDLTQQLKSNVIVIGICR